MSTLEIMSGLSRLFLGYVFMSAGGFKVFTDTPHLPGEWGGWVEDQPAFGLRVLGMAEILASFVLVMPLVMEVPRGVANVGAIMVIVLMAGAMYRNVKIGKSGTAFLNMTLAAAAGFVVWTQSVG